MIQKVLIARWKCWAAGRDGENSKALLAELAACVISIVAVAVVVCVYAIDEISPDAIDLSLEEDSFLEDKPSPTLASGFSAAGLFVLLCVFAIFLFFYGRLARKVLNSGINWAMVLLLGAALAVVLPLVPVSEQSVENFAILVCWYFMRNFSTLFFYRVMLGKPYVLKRSRYLAFFNLSLFGDQELDDDDTFWDNRLFLDFVCVGLLLANNIFSLVDMSLDISEE